MLELEATGPASREHTWGWAGRAPYGDLYRCARPGCKADPEDDPDSPCTGYDPDDD